MADAAHSTVTYSPSSPVADGTADTATITLKGATGTPVACPALTVGVTGTNTTLNPANGVVTADATGVAHIDVSTNTAQTEQLTVSCAAPAFSFTLTQSVTFSAGPVVFGLPDAGGSTVVVTPVGTTTFVADGRDTVTFTAVSRDASGNTIAGSPVKFTPSSTGTGDLFAVVTGTQAGPPVRGAAYTVDSNATGTAVVTLTNDGNPVSPFGDALTVTFGTALPTASESLTWESAAAENTTTWASGTALPTAVSGLGLAMPVGGATDDVFALGGQNGSGPASSIFDLDSGSGTWTLVGATSLVIPEDLPTVVGDGTQIYVIGGFDDGGNFSAALQDYDTVGNAVSEGTAALPPLNTARNFAAGALGSDGNIYVAGGFGGAGPGFLASIESWTAGHPSWTTSTLVLPTARNAMGGAASGTSLYFAGGCDTSGTGFTCGDPLASLLTINLSGVPAVSSLLAMPVAASELSLVAAPDGRLYAIGGNTGINANTATAAVFAYDTVQNAWFTMPPLQTARRQAGAAVNAAGQIVVTGGLNGSGSPLASTELYGPVLNFTGATDTKTLSGTHFAPFATVVFHRTTPGGTVVTTTPATVTTDATGAFSGVTATFASGAVVLYATDSRSQYPVSVGFTAP